MSNIKLDIPDITVVVEKGNEYLSSVTPSEIYQVLVNTGDNYNVVVDDPATIVTNGSGSYLTVADYASTASYALFAQSVVAGGAIIYDTISASNAYFGNLIVSNSITANLFTGSFSGDGSQLTGIGVTGGTNNYIPLWSGSTGNELTSSIMYQLPKGIFIGYNTTPHIHSEDGETLAVHSGETGVKNVIYAHGTIDDDYRVNIRNISSGVSASTNYKATADIGNDFGGYIEMGINSSTYERTDQIGGPLDAYLFTTGSDLLIGTLSPNKRIILFTGPTAENPTAIDNARIYVDSAGTVGINTNSISGDPESLYVGGLNTSSINLITAVSNVNNYSQINLINQNAGTNASSDIVATANNGTEESNFINMGINSSDYTVENAVGSVNDAYLYSTGNMLHIGNATEGQHIMFFAGGEDADANTKLILDAHNQHILSGSLNVTGSVNVFDGVINNLTASFAMTASYVSGAASDWDTLSNKPSGLVSSSTQINTGSFSGSFTGTLIGTSSWATNAISASYAPTILPNGTVSSSTQVNYSQLQNIPSNIVSSSTQASTWTVASSSVATSASYAPTILPSGVLSSSTQVDYNSIQNQPTTIPTASYVLNAVSSSFALTASYVSGAASDWDSISNKPSGLVSSSIQINTGSFSGSFTGVLIGTASWANNVVSASYAPTILPAGTVSSSLQINTGSFSGSITSASFATSASYAPTILPVGTISSSAQVNYTELQNIPLGIVSSSTQINTGSFSGSFTGTLFGTSSWANNAISSSIATENIYTASVAANVITFTKGNGSTFTISVEQSGTVESASYVEYTNVANKPTLVSSSTQINTGSFSGSFTGVLIGTSSWATNAISSSYAPTILPSGTVSSSTQVDYTQIQNKPSVIPTASYVEYSNIANIPVGLISSSTQVNYTELQNIPSGIVSSSTQINTGSFSGSFAGTLIGTSSWAIVATTSSYVEYNNVANKPTILSSSTQVDYNFIQNQPTTIPTASYVLNAVSSSFALTASYVSGAASNWDSIANKPSGLVSSSTQINTGSFSGSFTGVLIGTASWASNALSSSFSTTASAATSITFTPESASFATSASFAPTILPTGIVSSSTQINTGSFSGSFTGTLIGTSSWANNAISASYINPLGLPLGTVSSSVQINTGSFSGSFTGTLIGTGSHAVSSSVAETASYIEYTNVANKPTLVSSSTQVDYNFIQNQPTTIPTASYVLTAVSSSYALTASYVLPSGLPTGTVSSSTQINTGSFSGSFTGVLLGTSSNAISSSYVEPSGLPIGTISSSTQVSYTQLQNIPIGIVSSSAQINTGSFSGSFTGVLIGTGSWASNAISSSFATTASAATSITFTPLTASFATTASAATSITFTPVTASYALTASFIDGGFY